jgi:type III pantothenate kinase
LKVDVVVDVGNSCIKHGNCQSGRVSRMEIRQSTEETVDTIAAEPYQTWAIGGVVPDRIKHLEQKLTAHGRKVVVIASHQQIPIRTDVEHPETIGLDRLFDALGAISEFPFRKLMVIDAGTAITVNAISSHGILEGGLIVPGLRLMAQALNQKTAQLPLIEPSSNLVFPSKDTARAIQSGILCAAVGAVERCVRTYKPEQLLFAGGDGAVLCVATDFEPKNYVPALTLEGIRIAAEALP